MLLAPRSFGHDPSTKYVSVYMIWDNSPRPNTCPSSCARTPASLGLFGLRHTMELCSRYVHTPAHAQGVSAVRFLHTEVNHAPNSLSMPWSIISTSKSAGGVLTGTIRKRSRPICARADSCQCFTA